MNKPHRQRFQLSLRLTLLHLSALRAKTQCAADGTPEMSLAASHDLVSECDQITATETALLDPQQKRRPLEAVGVMRRLAGSLKYLAERNEPAESLWGRREERAYSTVGVLEGFARELKRQGEAEQIDVHQAIEENTSRLPPRSQWHCSQAGERSVKRWGCDQTTT